MEQNFTCLHCYEVAAFECACGSNVFLCAAHVGEHMLKPGSHSPTPLKQKLEDLRRFRDQKRAVCASVRQQLQALQLALDAERCTLQSHLDKEFAVSVEKLKTLYTRLLTKFQEIYKRLSTELLTMTEEVAAYEQSNKPVYSHYTEMFLKAAVHVPETVSRFLDVSSAAAGAVEIALKETARETAMEDVMRTWGLRFACDCSDCRHTKAAMKLPQVPAFPQPSIEPPVQSIVSVFPSQYKLTDVVSLQTTSYQLSQEIRTDSHSVFALLSGQRVLCCGGFNNGDCYADAYIIASGGSVEAIEPMSAGRASPGLAVLEDRAYLFGGGFGPRSYTDLCERHTGFLTSAEMLILPTKQWESVSSMSSPRSTFNPCVQGLQVYLCGGYTDTIEVYFPADDEYSVLSTPLPEKTWTVSVFTARDELLVISRNYMLKGPAAGPWQQGPRKNQVSPWSQCRPALRGESLFLSYKGRNQSINVRTGVMTRQWT